MKRTNLVDVRLNPNKGSRAQVMCFGDLHWGAATCDEDLARRALKMCVDKGIYVLGMGDMMECSLIGSVGDVYSQKISPEAQIEAIVDLLQPVKDAGLLIGIHSGNHEARITKSTSIDVTKIMCKALGTHFLDHSVFHLWRVGKQSYTGFSTHGSSGARLPYSKVKAGLDVFRYVSAELVMYGHLHGLDHMTQLYYEINKSRKTVDEKTRQVVLTGSYLRYRGGYAERKNLLPAQMGSPIVSLYGDRHCVYVSMGGE